MNNLFRVTLYICFASSLLCAKRLEYNNSDNIENTLNAIYNNDIEMVKYFIVNKDVDPNSITNSGDLLLYWAVKYERKKIINLLLELGANINKTNAQGVNAIMAACLIGNVELIKELEKLGANLNSGGDGFMTSPLTFAASSGNIDAVKYLVDSGVALKGYDYWAISSAMNYSILPGQEKYKYNYFEVIIYLLGVGTSKAGEYSPRNAGLFHWLVEMEIHDGVKTFIDYKIDINMRDNQGRTPLIYAIINTDRKMIQELIKYGANPSIQDDDGTNALEYAKEYKVDLKTIMENLGVN